MPITDPVVIVSDIHLVEEDDEHGKKLQTLIARLDRQAVRHFVLLGDIFDFCFGTSRYFHRKYGRIGQALNALAADGVEVTYLQGNHEFSLKDLPWTGVNLCEDRSTIIRLGETAIALTHGDVLGAPWHYHCYRWITRTRLFKAGGMMVPATLLDRLALGISRKSRQRGYSKKLDHRRIIAKIRDWYRSTGCPYGVVGHFHVPYHLREEQGLIMGLESWDKPNYLAFRDGSFIRVYL